MKALELVLTRDPSALGATRGALSADGAHVCYTLEDQILEGPKVYGKTAIPAGRYRVEINRSPKFSARAGRDVLMPQILGVPGFQGIRIHAGNDADDTEGCPLVGLESWSNPPRLYRSREAYAIVFELIDRAQKAGREIWITITQPVRLR